jgi:peptidoglycan/xylan/chitin deacetylase (PgdA/CDA1 family)
MSYLCARYAAMITAMFFAMNLAADLAGQTRTVVITIDDLPFVSGDESGTVRSSDAKWAASSNQRLLAKLSHEGAPVTGFVIEKHVQYLVGNAGAKILQDWIQHGFDLGNHTYEHLNFDDLTAEKEEDQIIRGESTFAPLMKAAGKKVEFFRFPYNHTGDTKEKHDAVADFLAQRGYKLAPCTIENSDWMFNSAYFLMRSRNDEASAARLREDYLAYTAAEIDYYARVDAQIFGYEPPEIMLLHDNPLNAEMMGNILTLFKERGYRFVSLGQAESDAAYQTPETFITSYGPMWAYRWAKVRGVKLDGSLEPEPPKWISEYGKAVPPAPRRPRSAP